MGGECSGGHRCEPLAEGRASGQRSMAKDSRWRSGQGLILESLKGKLYFPERKPRSPWGLEMVGNLQVSALGGAGGLSYLLF